MTISRETTEACLEEMGSKPTKKHIGIIGVSQNPIPLDNIIEAYEQATNKSWFEEYGED